MIRKAGFFLVALVALIAGLYISAGSRQPAVPQLAKLKNADLIGSYRPDFKLGNRHGAFVTPADFEGKTLLINFWATWCEPCLKEMPMLMELQSNYTDEGLQVIGIALDDVQGVRDFADKLGITYPVLVGAADVMETNAAYGNVTGMLPYSVLVDKEGLIRWQHLGEIKHDEVVELLVKLL